MNNNTPNGEYNVVADKAYTKDLIFRDISRCNDNRCPTAPSCARYLQMDIDAKIGETPVWLENYKGRDKVGLCDHFISAHNMQSKAELK